MKNQLIIWLYLCGCIWLAVTEPLCPARCLCSQQTGTQKENRVMLHPHIRLQAMYRMQHVKSTSYLNTLTPSTLITCIGLTEFPSNIPLGTVQLAIYGTSRSSSSDISKVDQLTELKEDSLSELSQLQQLFIKNNNIEVVPTNLFSSLEKLAVLSLAENRLRQILPYTFSGLSKLQRLDLSRNRLHFLSKLSSSPLEQLTVLLLNDNNISELQDTIFFHTQKLLELDVSNNSIRYIHSNALHSLWQLQKLNLAHNRLESVSSVGASANPSIRWLSLANNLIKIIDGASFECLQRLEYLDLSGNRISSVDSAMFGGLSNLKKLILNGNGLAVIEDGSFVNLAKLDDLQLSVNIVSYLSNQTFTGLSSLVTLDLSNNNIINISSIGCSSVLSNLQHLDLSHNKIKVVKSYTLREMYNLKQLYLDHNEIADLEDRAFAVSSASSMSKIAWLFVDYNQINYIRADTFTSTPFLKYLGLSNNRIRSIGHDSFRHLSSLITVDLAVNKLSYLPTDLFHALTSLVKLDLDSNRLSTLEPVQFSGLNNLIDLSLCNNSITSLQSDSFHSLIRVRQLLLADNLIGSVHMDTFSNMASLRYLNLSFNLIERVQPNSLIPIALNVLDLHGNQLRTLEVEVMESLTADGEIYLQDNKWSCSCELAWLTRLESQATNNEIRCHSPVYLKGLKIHNLSADVMCGKSYITSASVTGLLVKETTFRTTTSQTALQTRQHTPSVATLSIASADMPIGPLPAMPKLLCDKMPHSNRTYRGKKMVANWHVSLIEEGVNRVLCTGVQLDTRWVTLQASCIQRSTVHKYKHKYKVVIGATSPSPQMRSISKVVIHPEYERRGKRSYDIALIQLTVSNTPTSRPYHSPCILSQPDLEKTLTEFKIGLITTSQSQSNERLNWIDVSATKIKLAPKLCSSGKYVCSRFVSINRETHNIDNAPIYARFGIRDIDWGLAALTTSKWRTTKSGKSVVHKHMPLYLYINWFDYVMGKEDRYYT